LPERNHKGAKILDLEQKLRFICPEPLNIENLRLGLSERLPASLTNQIYNLLAEDK